MERHREPGTIRPFGEAAVLVDLAEASGTAATRAVQGLAAALTADAVAGLVDVTPGFTSLLVEFDPLVVERGSVEAAIRRALAQPPAAAEPIRGRHRSIPVVYGGEHGPDLAEVAELTGRTSQEVAERHVATRFEVYLLGFSPGFPYMGELPPELEVPRLATPRTQTPAGSVAITGRFTGIYPVAAPGGWRVIGRTSVRLFDPERNPPAYLLPGDTVTFRAIGPHELEAMGGPAGDW